MHIQAFPGVFEEPIKLIEFTSLMGSLSDEGSSSLRSLNLLSGGRICE